MESPGIIFQAFDNDDDDDNDGELDRVSFYGIGWPWILLWRRYWTRTNRDSIAYHTQSTDQFLREMHSQKSLNSLLISYYWLYLSPFIITIISFTYVMFQYIIIKWFLYHSKAVLCPLMGALPAVSTPSVSGTSYPSLTVCVPHPDCLISQVLALFPLRH